LSASDGSQLWGPIDLGGSADAAYDGGRVFTVNNSGMVTAFDASTGLSVWSRALNDNYDVGPPVAVDGRLFVVTEGVLTVLDETTGQKLWSGTEGGMPTSVAYTSSIVVLEYISGTLTAFDPAQGSIVWHTTGCCTGGGGDIPVIYQSRVYARDFWGDSTLILDLPTGKTLGSFSASTLPAFDNGLGFFLSNQTVEGRDLNNVVKWSFAGDGTLGSPPLAAGGAVYIGATSGNLYAVDENTGKQLWVDHLSAAVATANESFGIGATAGLGASNNLLVVPSGSSLTVYGN
jgi:outer membrane protein assembly factor BamB